MNDIDRLFGVHGVKNAEKVKQKTMSEDVKLIEKMKDCLIADQHQRFLIRKRDLSRLITLAERADILGDQFELYTEADLVSFGKYLMSKDRWNSIWQNLYQDNSGVTSSEVEEQQRQVHDADLNNWKEENKSAEADAVLRSRHIRENAECFAEGCQKEKFADLDGFQIESEQFERQAAGERRPSAEIEARHNIRKERLKRKREEEENDFNQFEHIDELASVYTNDEEIFSDDEEEWLENIVEYRIEKLRELLVTKGAEYARDGNKFHNFDRASELNDSLPARELHGFLTKHLVSYMDMLDDMENGEEISEETIDEKFGDIITYFVLQEALFYRDAN